MGDAHVRNHCGIDARPFLPCVLSPEIAIRAALEQYCEEVGGREGDDHGHGPVDDVLMGWFDTDPEKEHGDG